MHPLTLLAAMYVEKDGMGVDELLTRVQADFANLAALPPSQGIGKDSRDRARAISDAMEWLERCVIAKPRGIKKRAAKASPKKQGK